MWESFWLGTRWKYCKKAECESIADVLKKSDVIVSDQ